MVKRGFVLGAVATAAFSLLLTGVFFNSSAHTPTLEERFAGFGPEAKLSKEDQTGEYAFDKAHSYIGFRVRHMGLVDVPGSFTDFTGDVVFNADDVKSSTVEFTAQMKSVDTRVNARDNHLRSKDFFEVDKYPEMTFKSTSVKKKGKQYVLTGNLTMKGVTKEVTIPFRIYGPMKDERGTVRMGISGATAINRRDFNVNYGGNLPDGTPTLSDRVVVEIHAESVKKKEASADN